MAHRLLSRLGQDLLLTLNSTLYKGYSFLKHAEHLLCSGGFLISCLLPHVSVFLGEADAAVLSGLCSVHKDWAL